MKTIRQLAIVASIFLISTSNAMAATIVSSFDSDTDGWMVTDYGNFSAQSSPTWSGGSIYTADVFNGIMWSAPGKYLGDKTNYIGGTLSFDMKDSVADYAGGDTYYNLYLSSGSLILTHKGAYPTMPNQWVHDEAIVSYQGWYYATGDWMTPVTSEDFSTVLGNIEGLYITADWGWGTSNVAWLDNVVMTTTVPIPATVWLFGSGLAGLVGFGRRKIAA